MARPDLPVGTVTLLFTDIEGSTRLLHELGDRYADALAEHRRVLRHAFAAHRGIEVDTQGDAVFYAFARASDAVAAAEAGQRALDGGPVRVRIGLHTGEPTLTEEGYVGADVHLAARVMSAGHGGQVVVSEATARQFDGPLRGLGAHRLKDIEGRIQLFQLGEGRFPPLKTMSNSNLRLPQTPLLGRKKELAEVVRLLRVDGARLVTVTGPGGIGKTRFALEAARELVEDSPHGVWFVDLSALRDPALVTPTIASTLGAQGDLGEHVADRRLLLVLDNFEQVVDAAAEVAELLQRCANLQVLVTSRELLQVAGERAYPLRPLAESPAVELFRQRAEAADPDFDAPWETLTALVERLDRLPLALELAAARTRTLSADDLLARLEQRLPLLASRARDLPERQRTLRAAIEWSYELLADDEKRVFARLSVFVDGFDVDAAEAVCDAGLDDLESLIEKSLLRRAGSGRLGMLETIHEYAAERLAATPQSETVGIRHAEHFARRASAAELRGPSHAEWLAALRADHANFRAALGRLAGAGRACERLRLACDLGEYTYHSGSLLEGRRWIEDALREADGCPAELRALALAFAGLCAAFEGDLAVARRRTEMGVELARDCVDPLALAEALRAAALVRDYDGDFDTSARLSTEALELARAHGFNALVADLANNAGYNALEVGDLGRAESLLLESVGAARARDDAVVLAVALSNLALLEQQRGAVDGAVEHFRQALSIARTYSFGPASMSALSGIEALMAQTGAYALSARVHGAVDELVARTGEPVTGIERALREDAHAAARSALGETAADAAVAAGRVAGAEVVGGETLAWLEEAHDPVSRGQTGMEP